MLPRRSSGLMRNSQHPYASTFTFCRSVSQGVVPRDDLHGHRRVDARGSSDRLRLAHRLALGDLAARLQHFDGGDLGRCSWAWSVMPISDSTIPASQHTHSCDSV